jgi:hypothetical protein
MKKNAKTAKADVCLTGNGTVYLLDWLTKQGKEWMREHLPEDALKMGDSVAVEHRYIDDIVQGMRDDGLVVDGLTI